jgi:ABC-2 type transporter
VELATEIGGRAVERGACLERTVPRRFELATASSRAATSTSCRISCTRSRTTSSSITLTGVEDELARLAGGAPARDARHRGDERSSTSGTGARSPGSGRRRPRSPPLGAKLTARFVVGIVQMALLFAVGRLFYGVSLGPEPWALALPTVGIVAAGAAFGLVVAGLARSREAVLPLGSIAILTMAAAGGCWWPIDLEPRWMQSVARAFPTFWAMDAFNDLMIRRPDGERRDHRDARAPRLRRRLSGRRPHALPPPSS